jgi:DNA-binding CsgD family transcriptional regulator
MNPLGRRGRPVLDFLLTLYRQQDIGGFTAEVVRCLPRLIATDMTSFNEVDPATGRSRTVVAPAGADRFPGSEEIFEHHVREHPYVTHVRRFEDGQAHRVSDFVERGEFRRLAIYHDYYRRIGTEHQLAIALPGMAPWVRGIALSRGTRDYSDGERRLLTELGPQMIQAYRNAATLERARRATDRGAAAAHAGTAPPGDVEVVLLSPTGAVHFATPRARQWLASYFGGSSVRDARLPCAVADWVRAQRAALDASDRVPLPRRPLVVQRDGARLEIRLAAEWGQQALLVRERRRELSAGALEVLGLSPREAEVLAWVVEGKTNGEIGIILEMRPRTVAKHLERIFRKLGVETRTAAAASALSVAAS